MRHVQTLIRVGILLALGLLPASGVALAQAWLQPAGGYFMKLTGSTLLADSEYNYLGDVQPIFAEDPARNNASYRELVLSFYGEYGLARSWTLVVGTDLRNVRTTEDIRFIAGTEPARNLELGLAPW